MRESAQPSAVSGEPPRVVPGGSSHDSSTQTTGGEIIGRCRCLGGISIVISPPASAFRADERSVGEEIERSATSIAALLRGPPADVAGQAEQNRRPQIKSEKSPQLRRRSCYFPGGADHTPGDDLSQTKNSHEAPLWRGHRGYFPAEVTT